MRDSRLDKKRWLTDKQNKHKNVVKNVGAIEKISIVIKVKINKQSEFFPNTFFKSNIAKFFLSLHFSKSTSHLEIKNSILIYKPTHTKPAKKSRPSTTAFGTFPAREANCEAP